MNDINVRNEILDSIDNLNQVTMESTFEVFGSLLNACDKASMITEYSNSEDLSMFSIFQEAEVKEGDTKANAEAKKNSFGYKLIHFIPNLLKKLWAFIKSAWNGITTPESAKPKGGLAGILEKIKGVSIDKIKENPAAYGIPAALVTTVLAIVGISNGEKIKSILSKWSNGIKAFWVATKLAPYIAFEGGSFTTNIKKEGLLDTFKKLKAVLDQTNAITQRIASKGGSAKEIMAEMDKIIKSAQDLQQNPTFLTGENIVEESDTFIDLINKVKDVYDGFTQQNPVDINATAKPMFEDNGLEPSFIAEAEKKCTVLSKIANGIAVFFTATSTAFIGFIKWIGECLGLVKKANAELDGSGASVKMEDQSKDESTGEESTTGEESPAGAENPPLIENEEVDKAIVAVQKEPTKENAEKALDAIEKSINEINTAEGNGKAVQVVKDAKQAVSNVKAYLANKEEIDTRDAKKLAAMARGADNVKKLTVMKNVTNADIDKALKNFRTDERQAAVGTERTTKSGEKVSKKRGSTSGLSDAELMEILNNLPGNEIATVNAKQKKIVLKSGKTITGKRAHYQMDKITRDHNGHPGYGDTGNIRLSNNGNSWTIEYFEDAFDEASFIFESAIMEYFGISTEDAFVVESADGETVDAEAFVFESYDATAEEEEAAFEEINNHWYR